VLINSGHLNRGRLMKLHSLSSTRRCLTLDLASVGRHMDGGTDLFEECSAEKSSTKPLAFVLMPPGLASDATGAPDRLAGRVPASLIARLAAKCFSTLIFLMRIIVHPVIQLAT